MILHPNSPAALVTGAGQGVGEGVASALAKAGWSVALTDNRSDKVQVVAQNLASAGADVVSCRLDVTNSLEWLRAIQFVESTWGRLDLLVNNAGVSPRGTAESTDEDLWDATMAVNVKGAWLGIKTALPMLKRTKGTVVNVGSNLATRPARGMCVYCSSKAALYGLTRQIALEYIDDEVRCNMIAPGWVDTPGEREIQAREGNPDWPSGFRNITLPDDAGSAVLFLTTPAGRRMNGSILYLDSGQDIADDVMRVYKPRST
jgi:NAD(P)-dependent dehydrogenase (short-subunit alcohol dehydrogenase family)